MARNIFMEEREPPARRPGEPLYTARRVPGAAATGATTTTATAAPGTTVNVTTGAPVVNIPGQKKQEGGMETEQQRRERIVRMLEQNELQRSFRAAQEGETPLQYQDPSAIPPPEAPPVASPAAPSGPSQAQQDALEREMRREQARQRNRPGQARTYIP